LSLKPQILLLDEPTSALDHALRASIVQLLHDIAKECDMTYICISHELDIVQSLCENVLVLQKGEVIEQGACDRVFASPTQGYTRALLESITS
ncbi:MAG: ABC transporter ATP-binding protein, partial [Helicobacter sp.]|nr:ABC transporter ATP-binding protein [Helicobacter sp.]